MPQIEKTATAEDKPAKRSQPALNYLLLLLLLGLSVWTGNKLLSHTSQVEVASVPVVATDSASEKLDSFEATIKRLEERTHTLEMQAESQQKTIAMLQTEPKPKSSSAGEALSSGVIAALEARISELDKKIASSTPSNTDNVSHESLKGLEARLWKLEAQNSEHGNLEARKLAKIRAFYALQTALFSGKPYVNEYAVFSDLVGEENDYSEALDIINSYAEEGVPSEQTLLKEFMHLVRQSLNLPPPEDAPFFERLSHNVSSLVTIRKVGENQKGLDMQAIFARTESHLKKGELEAAVAEIQSMNISDQALFSSWLEDTKMRINIPATLLQIQESLLSESKDTDSKAGE
jgi:hypothetical protein